MIQGKFKKQFF